MISVIIPTRNRPDKIKNCLRSILSNSYRKFEIIVTDQSENQQTEKLINKIRSDKIRYFPLKTTGKSGALNFALEKARGNIFAFTDDDCIVSKDWLLQINKIFNKRKNISGIFGEVLPYKALSHRGLICPCTHTIYKEMIISLPCYHAQYIGFGNNMAYRKEVIKSLGGFKKWLGPNSVGSNAEDAELALRMILKGYKILISPKVKVWHNKWLSMTEMNKQMFSYYCGETACYGYFSFLGYGFARKVIMKNLFATIHDYKRLLRHTVQLRFVNPDYWVEAFYVTFQLIYKIKGLMVGLLLSLYYPISIKTEK